MQNVRVNNSPQALKPNPAAPTVGPKTVSNTAVKLTDLAGVTLHDRTDYVMVQIETAEVRYCPDGTAPTTTLGIKLTPGQTVLLSLSEANQAKWIRGTASDASLQIAQYLI